MTLTNLEKGFEQARQSIFRIEANWVQGGASATGFAVGRLRGTQKLIVATAAHVLDVPADETVGWTVQQFDETCKITREQQVYTNRAAMGDVPWRCHKDVDVGFIVVHSKSSDGELFSAPDERPLQLMHPEHCVTPATRVGWAGFPGSVEAFVGHPTLCYFEGVISSTLDTASRRLYIVDGHLAHGVSGGPVWHWCAERDRMEIVGVVSAYGADDTHLPGFCVFEPIGPIIYYLRHWQRELKGEDQIEILCD